MKQAQPNRNAPQPLLHVQVKTVDNYQGEENDIVLLSLVRSNNQDNIGFLKISNRICVALSRARLGMYIFGNASTLRAGAARETDKLVKQDKGQREDDVNKHKHLWLRILEVLSNRGDIDDKLTLKCLQHDDATIVRRAEDFEATPEGGCMKICGLRMSCGHACESYCHPLKMTEEDPSGHSEIRCLK